MISETRDENGDCHCECEENLDQKFTGKDCSELLYQRLFSSGMICKNPEATIPDIPKKFPVSDMMECYDRCADIHDCHFYEFNPLTSECSLREVTFEKTRKI